MPMKRRVYVSLPSDSWLTPAQNKLKWGIVSQIDRLGYIPEIFYNPKGKRTLTSGKAFSASEAEAVARRCVGAAIIGLPRWTFTVNKQQVKLASEFCHYEAGLARTLGLPLLIVRQQDMLRRAVFDSAFGPRIADFPQSAGLDWLQTKGFKNVFADWRNELSKRRDVFLGYCGTSAQTAIKVKTFLKRDLGVTVLDWRTDFSPGLTVLEQIQDAAARCSAGIFLFTNDDHLKDDPLNVNKAVPRDNVVFEAGYFTSIKDKRSVLIIREDGAKMPADLGGKIYAPLGDRKNIKPVQKDIRRFIAAL
jgi:Predicted nucleotide-binding protein containing TIR-like domain